MTQIAQMGIIVILCIALRVVALSSDAYPRLSWSTGLLTDEGYYLHNARNVVLFGDARQDEWNNALIMPTLHAVQVGVFRVFGVGIVQARGISAAFSLLILWLFWVALKKWLGTWAAGLGVLLLGLDHAGLLYHRLALLDTPAACLLVGAFWCFVRGIQDEKRTSGWGIGCGLIMTLAYTVRGLSALLFVVPIVAAWSKECRPFMRGYLVGLCCGMACYVVVWYLPNRAEISRYNAYYLHSQLMPRSMRQLWSNITTALFSWQRGMIPYLVKHTPVIFGLALWQTIAFFRSPELRRDSLLRFLVLWLLLLMATFACVNYAPSRYYVLFYPPLFALAILALMRNHNENRNLTQRRKDAKEKQRTTENTADTEKEYGSPQTWGVRGASAFIALWLFINGYWLTDWIHHLSYKQLEADRQLARMLPEGSWVIGSVANGLCINNKLRPVNVIPGLCNGDAPIEKRKGDARYILILDGKWRQGWWNVHYGAILTPEHRIAEFDGLLRDFFQIGLYRVPD